MPQSASAVAAGRANADSALFPYYTDDKIHDGWDQTGGKIDDTGEMTDGSKFTGFTGLRDYLKKNEPQFLTQLTRKLLGYALGRAAWKTLVTGNSLQLNCNQEGVNIFPNGNAVFVRTRLGIASNQENDCGSPDSRIGFGGERNLCGAGGDNAVGNVASCAAENGDRNSYLFGYIFVR